MDTDIKSIREIWQLFMEQRIKQATAELLKSDEGKRLYDYLEKHRNEVLECLAEGSNKKVEFLLEAAEGISDEAKRHVYIAGYRDGLKAAQSMLFTETENEVFCFLPIKKGA